MKTTKKITLLIAIGLILCSLPVKSQTSAPLVNKNALRLFKAISSEFTAENVVISPVSINSMLEILFLGTKGELREELAEFLGIDLCTTEPVYSKLYSRCGTSIFTISNALVVNKLYSLDQDFLSKIKVLNNTTVFEFDNDNKLPTFSSIDEWINGATNNKIKTISVRLSNEVPLVVLNTTYFKAAWESIFDVKLTKRGKFKIPIGKNVEVDYMNKHLIFDYYDDEYVQILRIPYDQDEFSMNIMLPNRKYSLEQFVEHMDDNYFDAINFEPKPVYVQVPKFKIEIKIDLKKYLPEQLFSKKTDWSKISLNNNFFMDDILHSTYISIDERQTEAASVTIGRIASGKKPMKYIDFNANRPFLFYIADNKTNTIIYIGQCYYPN